jgi:hypothetical protein
MKTTPTTQVTAYIATDVSLWLDEDECLYKNAELLNMKLREHIERWCDGVEIARANTHDVAYYISNRFDEIKSILEGNVIESARPRRSSFDGAVDSEGK